MRNLILYLVLSVCFASFVGCVADGPESTMQEQAESAPTSGRDRALAMLTAAVGADAPLPEMGCQKGSVGADSWMCCFFDFCCWYGYPGEPNFCQGAPTSDKN